jgi:hypothetical protein
MEGPAFHASADISVSTTAKNSKEKKEESSLYQAVAAFFDGRRVYA